MAVAFHLETLIFVRHDMDAPPFLGEIFTIGDIDALVSSVRFSADGFPSNMPLVTLIPLCTWPLGMETYACQEMQAPESDMNINSDKKDRNGCTVAKRQDKSAKKFTGVAEHSPM